MALAAHEIKGPLVAKCGLSDLVQETLIEAHKCSPGLEPGSTALKGWLGGILRRKAIDWARKYRLSAKRSIRRETPIDAHYNGRFPGCQLADPEPTPATRASSAEQHRLLEAAIEALPRDERTVILLHGRDRLSWDEIGRRIGRSPEAARKLWSRAVVRLQNRLNQAAGDQ
jgi:RNA polymerase sigma-70 factor (ECF subfamily)